MSEPTHPGGRARLATLRLRPAQALLLAIVALSLAYSIWCDVSHVRWAFALTQEGSPPPPHDASSPTGYEAGQRHFLAAHQRGETYRWTARAQAFLLGDVVPTDPYLADNVPNGRTQHLPAVYTVWLAGLAAADHALTGLPLTLTAERVGTWEPLLGHLLVMLGAVLFIARRFGLAAAAAAAVFLALYPPAFGQHLPGALSADPWALWLAVYAIASAMSPLNRDPRSGGLALGPTFALAVAVSLNPSYGFIALLIVTAAQAGSILTRNRPEETKSAALQWCAIGAGIVIASWALSGSTFDPAASELRHAHPWYALAWIGFGIALDRLGHVKASGIRGRHVWSPLFPLVLTAPLFGTQVLHGYGGWLHASADLQRFVSIGDSPLFSHLGQWLSAAPWNERFLLALPISAGAAAAVLLVKGRSASEGFPNSVWTRCSVIWVTVLLVAWFYPRWLLAAAWLSVPLVALLADRARGIARVLVVACAGAYFVALAANPERPTSSFRSLQAPAAVSQRDLENLVYRHFSHWLVNQQSGRESRVLATPALADSLVFHGGERVLLSSAWESHPGHVAAARILSAPEASEAEAVIQSVGLTHLVLTSWDVVLPLLVKAPVEPGRDTLHDRLQRWVLPPYLRPLPYRLPPTPGFRAEKLAVFEVVAPQDEALALGRLAEYFIEVDRLEPASLVAETLVQAYPLDLNAAMSRALVYEATGKVDAFQAEVARLGESLARDAHPADEDRRVLRAVVLALGRRHDVAREQLADLCQSLSAEGLRQLTPRQTFRLRRLLELYRLDFPSPELAELARTRSIAYAR